ncbi:MULTISPECIES: TetR/AcrR family transcriptional regulator [unclassified Streptosporangium]|uniref:TetR/AcrR family transcriptional regulator n=1 Tax=unclassified Streptosporangium TaxID=2632669 RepID=UPI002E2E0D1C|nr:MULTISPECIES: TetR/AcrR family transcriptional regulator [unclassified Streptosporangium]
MKPTRVRILDAADELMRTIGLAHTTTKAIARAAGCSEAALYKHFESKSELFVFVLKERMPRFAPLLVELETGGPRDEDDIEETLVEIARQTATFYASSFPIGASLFSDPVLLRRHGEELARLDLGPHKPLDALTAYLGRQRAAGRVRADADPAAAAVLFLGACFHRAFMRSFAGDQPLFGPAAQPLDEFAAALTRTLLEGVRDPGPPAQPARVRDDG